MVQTPVMIVHIKLYRFYHIYIYSKEYAKIVFSAVYGDLMTSQLCDGYMLWTHIDYVMWDIVKLTVEQQILQK